MPFATNKPDACINVTGAEYPPFVMECGVTESYEAVLADTVAWLTQTNGAVRAVLLIKLTEHITDVHPPPESIDAWAEDDNSPKECNVDDPAYEHLRASTVTEEWTGPLEGFAELWRLSASGQVERDGEAVTVFPRPPGGVKKLQLTKADILGHRASRGDQYKKWDLDLGVYCTMLEEAIAQSAFQRRVRYIKAMEKTVEEENKA